ncbi:MAG TPA: PhoPQ-activated protein PqaA family protein, partial [Planctomycetaceae bacterium]|nr:PhoPQ-activated protein PqaA family protein [Planctomycetaceae bacterium]
MVRSEVLPVRVLSSVRVAKALALLLAGACAAGTVQAGETALDRYVAKPDATYSWKIDHKLESHGSATYVIDLKSQTWRKPDEVNRT